MKVSSEKPIKVCPIVMAGLQATRDSGTTNMFDVTVVCIQAVALGYPETADWIKENKNTYIESIVRGFESESG